MKKAIVSTYWVIAGTVVLTAGCAGSDAKTTLPTNTPGAIGANAGATGSQPIGPGPSVGSSGTSSVGVGTPALGVPCGVAKVVSSNCTSCHAATPIFGAPMPLMTLDDFHKPAFSNKAMQVFQMIAPRINSTDIRTRMPPSTQAAVSAPDLQTFNTWLTGGAVGSSGQAACAITAGPALSGSAGNGVVMTGAGGMGSVGTAGSVAGDPPTHMGGSSDKPIAYNDPMMKCYKFLAHDAGGDKTKPYAVTTTPDQYTNFHFMPEWQGMMYVRSMVSHLDNKQVIHHWLFYKDSAPNTDGLVEGSSGAHPDGNLMDGWAPGGSDLYFDPDVGEEMPGNVSYTLETHHNNTTGATAPDASGIEICVTPSVPTNVASLSWLGTDAISGTSSSGTCKPTNTGPIHVLGGTPHMHTKGIHMKVDIMRANGMAEVLHDAPFDFQNQHSYGDATIIMPGDSLTTTCEWSEPASFGERTVDEMCYFFTLYYPKLSLTDGAPVANLVHGSNTCLGL